MQRVEAPRQKMSPVVGCVVVAFGSLGLAFFVGLWLLLAAAASETKTSAPPPPKAKVLEDPKGDAAAELRLAECRTKLKKAERLEMLYDLSWKSGQLPRVVVGPTFFTVPFDAKQGFADTVNCFLMGGESNFIRFDLLDWRTNKVVGTYSAGRLELE